MNVLTNDNISSYPSLNMFLELIQFIIDMIRMRAFQVSKQPWISQMSPYARVKECQISRWPSII